MCLHEAVEAIQNKELHLQPVQHLLVLLRLAAIRREGRLPSNIIGLGTVMALIRMARTLHMEIPMQRPAATRETEAPMVVAVEVRFAGVTEVRDCVWKLVVLHRDESIA